MLVTFCNVTRDIGSYKTRNVNINCNAIDQSEGAKKSEVKIMNLFSFRRLLGLCILALTFGPHLAHGGGMVKGKVTFEGHLPPAEKFIFASFPNSNFCAKHPDTTDEGRRRVIYPVETSKDGGLKHAIVYVKGLQDKQWMSNYGSTDFDIRLCDFLPLTAIVIDGKNVRVVNHDADPDDPKAEKGVAHTIRAYEVLKPWSNPLFSVGLPIKGSELNKQVKMKMWKRGSIIRLTCDQHEWMRSFLLPMQSPFYSRVDENGLFAIENIPPGRHPIVVWHPKVGSVEQIIDVPDGGLVELNFEVQEK